MNPQSTGIEQEISREETKKRNRMVMTAFLIVTAFCILCFTFCFFGAAFSENENKKPPLPGEDLFVDMGSFDASDASDAGEPSAPSSEAASPSFSESDSSGNPSGAVSSSYASGSDTSGSGVSGSDTSEKGSASDAVSEPPVDPDDGNLPPIPPPPANDGVTLQEGTAPEGYLNQIYFLGDSTTYGLLHYGILGSKHSPRVWAPKSGTLALFNATREKIYDPESRTEMDLSEIASKYRPSYLVITLGVNGIAMMKESYFKSEYAKVISIIREASPDTKIILQTMYPVSSAYHETKSLNQEKILLGNGWIHDIAAENGCRFLNSYAYFLDEKGYMDLAYENGGDGMHFNAAGYRRMIDYLVAHPYPDTQ